MKAQIVLAILAMTPIAGFGQLKSDQIKLLTVCEVIGNRSDYTDAAVVIVGRKESSVSMIDRYDFISQDHCPHPIVTHRHQWPNKILVLTSPDEAQPKPPGEMANLARPAIASKLSIVRKGTVLGFHLEPQYTTAGNSIHYSGDTRVPNEWVLVYGRLVPVPNLTEDCGRQGCGGDDTPLILIAERQNVRQLAEDGTVLSVRE